MGYCDPKIRQQQQQYFTLEEECKRLAADRYGLDYYDLPAALRDVIRREVFPPYGKFVNRRFEYRTTTHGRSRGWHMERVGDEKQREAERLAAIEVRKRRAKRVRARRFNQHRPLEQRCDED